MRPYSVRGCRSIVALILKASEWATCVPLLCMGPWRPNDAVSVDLSGSLLTPGSHLLQLMSLETND